MRAIAVRIALIGWALMPCSSGSELLSEASDFGPDTVTLDTETGLLWLDLTESTNLSYAQAITETVPGGQFEGWRLATGDEVATLFEHAGLDLTAGSSFVPQSYGPALALGDLVGVVGTNGNCGSECAFSFSQGWRLRAPVEDPANYYVDGIAWFDNSAPLNPLYPQAPIGRASLGGFTSVDEPSSGRGTWLVEAPEPGAAARAVAGIAALAALARRSARRSV